MKRNLLLLMADQFAYHAMSRLGSPAQTPHLDSIAQEGLLFSSCYSNAPLCLPARASLATGRYPVELDAMDNYCPGLTENTETWMQRIRDMGYETSMFGKVHLHSFCPDLRSHERETSSFGYQIVDELPGPRTYGSIRSSYYDHLKQKGLLEIYQEDMHRRYDIGPVYDSSPTPLPTEDYADVYIADRALDYLNQVSKNRPWFCTVSFGGPHDPWDTPAEYAARYQNVVPPAPLAKPVSCNPQRPKGVYDALLNGKYDPGLTEDLQHMTQEDIAALRRSYYGHVSLIDAEIGRILDCLKARGLLENTVIAFTSDHGEENGDYGLLFKQTFFESSVRVPLLLRVPGMAAQQISRPVSLMDLGPTLCELLGASQPLGHARSLVPLIHGRIPEENPVVSQIFGETMLLADGYKAVFNAEGALYILFDLKRDPEESRNLAATPEARNVECAFARLLMQWQEQLYPAAES